MLEDYFIEFDDLARTVSCTLENYFSDTVSAEALSNNLNELKHYLDSIDLSVRTLPRDNTTHLMERVRQCRLKLEVLQKKWLLCTRNKTQHQNTSQRDKSAYSLEKTQKATRTLDEALKMAGNSERLGEDILSNLYSQRETIQRTQANTKQVSQNLEESETVVSRMSRWWNQFL